MSDRMPCRRVAAFSDTSMSGRGKFLLPMSQTLRMSLRFLPVFKAGGISDA